VLFGSKDILCLDFTSGDISGALGKYNKKGITVTDCFRSDLPEGVYEDGQILDFDRLVEILSNMLSENDIGSIETNAVINSTSIVMRDAILPKVSHEELQAIIDYQIDQFIPINPEDYVVKFLDLGTVIDAGLEKTAVLLIGVPEAMAREHLSLLEETGLKPGALDYEGNAIAKLIATGGAVNYTIPEATCVGAVNLGYKHTNLSIVENGVLKVSRYIERSLESAIKEVRKVLPSMSQEEIKAKLISLPDIWSSLDADSNDVELVTAAKNGLNEIAESIGFIFRYYQTRENYVPLDYILIYGIGSQINGIDKFFRQTFEKDSYVLRSMENVKWDEDINLYANAIGGLIRLSEVKK